MHEIHSSNLLPTHDTRQNPLCKSTLLRATCIAWYFKDFDLSKPLPTKIVVENKKKLDVVKIYCNTRIVIPGYSIAWFIFSFKLFWFWCKLQVLNFIKTSINYPTTSSQQKVN